MKGVFHSSVPIDPGKAAAVEAVGSIRALARALGLAHVSVLRWKHIPAERVEAVERVTNVDRRILRPDLFKRVK